ncbi:MAG: hypothetical protein AAF268_15660 [Cyanobacteria bacterium P01_A01_bin.3]
MEPLLNPTDTISASPDTSALIDSTTDLMVYRSALEELDRAIAHCEA